MKAAWFRNLVVLVFAFVVTAGQNSANASSITGSVSLNTSILSGPFELAFILTDGSGTGDANNAVTLSNFVFGVGGSPGAVDPSLSLGGESGNLVSGVSLFDSSFLNIFASSFTPGSSLTFDFGLSTVVDPGGTPDQFSIVLLRSDGTVVHTVDPSGVNSLLIVNIDSIHPSIVTFASDLTPAPTVSESTPVPEPSSLVLFATGLLCILGLAAGTRR
jgi:hypothetical protein